jgi:putative ABC transport system permease protein
MFRNYLAATWRSAVRDRFYAGLNVLGLGLGFAASILIGLFVRDELSYDRFLPGHQDVYRVQATLRSPGQPLRTFSGTPLLMAQELTLAFPEIARTARVAGQNVALRHGEVEANEAIETADADFFAVLGFPLLRGDPATALAEPDSIVLTRRLALKYFGTIECVGQTLDLNQTHPVRVTGIAEDPPTNTTNGFSALLSGKTSYSAIATGPQQKGAFLTAGQTFLRLKPGASPETLDARLPAFVMANYPGVQGAPPGFDLFLKPLADVHLAPNNPGTSEINDRAQTLYAVAATGVLILLLAGINFVNLVTARATKRALEVGVRKALGALRGQLMMQFMGESVFYALTGMLLGLALAELCLPSLNAFLDRQIAFDYGHHPLFAALPVATALVVGLVAGIYPALVLSSFPPAMVLKSRSGGPIGGGKLRLALVVFQFTVTIALVIATSVIYRQNVFASSQALHFDKDLVLTVDLAGMPLAQTPNAFGLRRFDEASLDALHTRLAAVPGVRVMGESLAVPAVDAMLTIDYHPTGEAGRSAVGLNFLPVGPGFFDAYGLHLIAGRDFSRDRADDKSSMTDLSSTGSAIINEAAVRALGFADAAAAIGQEVGASGISDADPDALVHHRIIGVVPDFPLDSIRSAVPPTLFLGDPGFFRVLSLKLSGVNLPETLRGIDAAWREFVPARPITRGFVDDRIARLYLDEARQGRLFAAFAGFAAAIGCLGLVGLSAYTAERRTKEIGIRKALGASTSDVLRLLIWQFTKPVVLANLLAWPIAWWFMRRWLDGFAYRVELGPTVFVAAGAGALVIAVLTTAGHAFQVARARPVTALRDE